MMAKLSPQAAVIWDEFNEVSERVGVFEDYGDALAAAIETLADQVTPANGSRRNNEIRADILAIAAELRGTTTETL
jgi:hypothetical protein